MLNKQSMPVWILNDILIGLLGGDAIFCLAAAAALLPYIQVVIDYQPLADAFAETQAARAEAVAQRRAWEAEANRLTAELAQQQARNQQLIATGNLDRQIRRELLGLRGDMTRTLFVIDISGSMAKQPSRLDTASLRPNWGAEETPWLHVRRQVDSWLRYLPVGSFRLICFNHELFEFPAVEEGWQAGERAREQALDYLADLEPNGYTYTELALERAAAWEPTTIILFTDGAPSDAAGKLERDQQTRILDPVGRQDWEIPINVVALNNYLIDDLGVFLQNLAGSTGGGFMGL